MKHSSIFNQLLRVLYIVGMFFIFTSHQLQATSSITAVSGIDLELSMISNPTEYTVFTNQDFTLTITNNGTDTATGITVYAPYPSGLAFTSSTASQGNYEVWTSLWNIGTLASGQSATLTLSLFVLNNTDDIMFFAQVQSANETDIDSTPDNNTTQIPTEDDEASVTVTYGSGSTGGGGGGGNNGDDVDIELSISANHIEANAGQEFSYILSVTNKGPDNATGVKVDFPLPTAHVQYVSNSNDQTTYNSTTGVWNIGNLAKNVTRSLLVNVEVVIGGTITATAELTHLNQTDSDSTPDNGILSEDDMATVDVIGLQIDLELFLELAPGQSSVVPVGSNVTYRLHVENKGPTVGYNTKIRAIMAANIFSLVGTDVSMGYFLDALGVWVIGDIPPFATQTMDITATVLQPGTHTYTCEVRTSNVPDVDSTPSNYDPNEDDISSVTISTDGTANVADLSLNVVVDNPSANAGDTRTLTLTVANAGPADATGITVEDVLPSGLTISSSTPSMGAYAGNTWTVGDLDNGEFATLDIEVLVGTLTAPITYFAQIETTSPNDTDSTAGNDSDQTDNEDDEATVTITQPTIDLELTVESSITSANIGDAATLTLTLENTGGADATSVTIEDVFPAELTLNTATPSMGSYSVGIWTIGDLDSGEIATLDLQVTVGAFTDSFNYFAQVQAANPNNDTDSTPANDTDQTPNEDDEGAITITQPMVDMELTVSKNATSDPHVQEIELTLENTGAANGTGITVEDVFPSGLVLNTSNASKGTYTSGVWTVGGMSSNETSTLTLTVSTLSLTGQVAYFAQVMTANPDNDADSTLGNDSDQSDDEDDEAATTLAPAPIDLELSVAASTLIADVGDDVTLTLTLENNGPSDAANIIVQDILPSGFSLNSSNATHGTYSNDWLVGTLLVGEIATLTLEVTVDVITTSLTYFAEVQTASPNDVDSTPGNNPNQTPNEDDEASVTIAPTVAPTDIDLELSITANVSEFNLYQNVTYTIEVSNNGPATATGIEVANALPSGMAFTSKTESQGNFNLWAGVWTVGSLAVGESATADITLFVLNNSTAISNFAQVKAANENDSDSTPNNSAGIPTEDDEDSVTIIPAGSNNNDIDLALSKTANVSIANAGDAIAYTLTIVNNGTVTATGVSVEDVLPSNVTFNSSTASSGTYNDATGIWDIGTIGIGVSASLTINVTVDVIVLPMTNFAQVKTANEDDVDSTPDNNSGATPQEDDEDSVVIQPDTTVYLVDLALSTTFSSSTAEDGDTRTYTITVINSGNADAVGVTIEDQMPSELTLVGATTVKGSYDNDGTWTVGNLDIGETAVLTIDVMVGVFTSPIVYFAQVQTASPDDSDSTAGNDTDQTPNEDDESSATLLLAGSTDIDLEATLTSSNPNLTPWTTVDFTLEITNNGAAAASGVMVDFPVPEGMAFTSKTESQGSYNLWFQTWDIGTLQPGETATLVLTLFTLNPGTDVTAYTEITAANENDIDSTPDNGNGVLAVEDDEAVSILSSGGGAKNDLGSQIIGESTLLTVHSLFPVPTRDFVNILFNSESEMIDIVLYDYSGRKIYSQTIEVAQGENTTQLDLSAYPSGWYFVSMETEEGSVRAKVVKQ
ncbi:MAG: T9SS type A sorting domain-containing protein [Chitinophagales bacterium]